MFTCCNERKGHTRCEGCQQLYCLPCMNKHHEELMIHFELLTISQKEIEESFHVAESTWQTNKAHPCLTVIDQWEQEVIARIQQIAAKARTATNELMTKNMSDIRQRLGQLAFDIEQRQQEGNYLDNDIAGIRKQLEQLDHTIKHVNEKVRLDYSATNKVDWSSLIYVTTEKKLAETRFSLPEIHYKEESSQEKLWNNLRKLLRNKHTSNEYKNRPSSCKHTTSTLFEPIVLTSFDSPTCSISPQNSNSKADLSSSDHWQPNPFANDDPFNYITFTTMDPDQFLPHASEA